MSKIFYTADTHFCHSNILHLNNRPFCDKDEMNRVLIENWNNTVGKDDLVIHGGDVIFNGNNTSQARKILNELNGKIILVKGNHDGKMLKDSSLRKRFEGIYDTYEVHDGGDTIIVSHMPLLEWNKMYRGAKLFYGHIHNNIDNDTYHIMAKYRPEAYNIGVDITSYKPCTKEEVISYNKAFQVKNPPRI